MAKSKKAIMGLAAIFILVFHFYIPIFKDIQFGKTLSSMAFIGVDMFFFVSAISCSTHAPSSYGKFMLSRIKAVYFPFIVFVLIGGIYKGWTIGKMLRIIAGIALFQNGGGSFLWFFPGIMIFYLITPLILYFKKKNLRISMISILIIWVLIVVLLNYGLGYTKIFILLFRLPIYIVGLYYIEIRGKITENAKILLTVAGLILGFSLFYIYMTKLRSVVPMSDIQYLASIPFDLSLAALICIIKNRVDFRFKPLTFIGGFTLELYSLQMIFGYKLIQIISKIVGTNIFSFLVLAIILITVSYIFSLIRNRIMRLLKF